MDFCADLLPRDNEKPIRSAIVPSFQAKGRPITNEEVFLFASLLVLLLTTYSMLFISKLLVIQSCLLHGHSNIPTVMVFIISPTDIAMAIPMDTRTVPPKAWFILRSHT
jgi:hypothetical protein